MRTICCAVGFVLLAGVGSGASASANGTGDSFAYIGTYTDHGDPPPTSKGIYLYRMPAGSPRLIPLGLAAPMSNPSFLVHPNGRFLYAVSENFDYQAHNGTVSAFSIEPKTGRLAPLNSVSSRGAGPCHISLDRTGRLAMVSNYGSGSFAAFPLRADGRLAEPSAFLQYSGKGVDPKHQEGPHAHCVVPSPDNRFAIAVDLGLDRLLVYRLDPAKGSLEANDPPFYKLKPGAGPRHFTFSPSGKFAYVTNELKSSVTAFAYDAGSGRLTELQTVGTLPAGFSGLNATSELQVHASGKFLYAANRGHDSIAVFAVDPVKGTLKVIEHVPVKGKWPRHFAMDPTGSYLLVANERSNNLVVFGIDAQTGRLTPAGQEVGVSAPTFVMFMPVK
jgi:6-phosphogluconolactonase